MNGSPDPDAEQERVRRLLADLAHSDHVDPPAVPDDVAARLDRTLAGLSAAGPDETTDGSDAADEEPDGAPVVPLAERRAARTSARGRLGRALVAAAAVAVVAGGTAVVVDQVGSGTSTSSDSAGGSSGDASSGEGSDGADSGSSESLSQDEATEPDAPLAEPPAPSLGGTDDGGTQSRTVKVPAVSEGNLAADVTRLLAAGDVAAPDAAGDPAEAAFERRLARRSVIGSGCAVPDPDRGAATFVVLDGEPAVLVVGPVSAQERRVEVLGCAEGAPLTQTQVPAAG